MQSPQPSCRAEIRRHIAGLPEGAIFSTKDVVQCGKRNTIDQTLWRMVKSNEIERLARGLFVSSRTRKLEYSDYEIAEQKTKGFGNEIVLTGQECALELGLLTKRKDSPQEGETELPRKFLTTGCTTRFRRGDHYIYLRKASSTKTKLGDDKAGKAVRALWWRKEENLDSKAIYKAIKELDNNDYHIAMNQAAIIPSWLRDQLRVSHLTIWRRYSARKPAARKRVAAEYYLPILASPKVQSSSHGDIKSPIAPGIAFKKTATLKPGTKAVTKTTGKAAAKTAFQLDESFNDPINSRFNGQVRLPDLRLTPLQNSLQDSVRHWLIELSKQSDSWNGVH
ncbi:type IV toxin-antitoxin system AbiEi family antitoxin domain-containing protein [bacterium]|nr:type IV toxin-antitoxin system AbiEi family antitoxin domain-containing protein [bacterium]